MPSLRKTKIVATIGPASESAETIRAMIQAGMNVARINLSFGTGADQVERVERVRAVAKELGTYVAVMADTKGIEIRTGAVAEDAIELVYNDEFSLFCDTREGNADGVSVSYGGLYKEVMPGIPILLDDGAIELMVTRIEETTIHTRVIHGGILRANKGVNLPDTQLSLSAVSPENQDEVTKEMMFAVENDIEYIAASFIQSADDIFKMKGILLENDIAIPIIAKI